MILRERNGGRGLASSVIRDMMEGESARGRDMSAEWDPTKPTLDMVKRKLKSTTCCDKKTIVAINEYGVISSTCIGKCARKKFICPFCVEAFTRFFSTKQHFTRKHSELNKCTFCSDNLPKDLESKMDHLSSHILKKPRSTEDEVDFIEDSSPGGAGDAIGPDMSPCEFSPIGFEEVAFQPQENVISTHFSSHSRTSPKTSEEEEREEFEGHSPFHREEHFKSLFNEFVFTVDPGDEQELSKYDTIIRPLKVYKKDDYGIFLSEHNLRIVKFARDCHLSEDKLSRLIFEMKEYYKCPMKFQSAETLIGKLNKLGQGSNGITFKKMKCAENGHVVCVIPIEEGLKLLVSKDTVLSNFHVSPRYAAGCGDDDPLIDFRDSKKFSQEAKRVEDYGAHYISIIANRDSFPAYLSATLPLKGFYYVVGNLSNPTLGRNVVLFGFGMTCESCMECVEESWIRNINRLSIKNFLLYHRLLEEFVVCRVEYDAEPDDSPQVADNTMSKHPTGNLGCPRCRTVKNKFDDPNALLRQVKKSLEESEKIYNEQCVPIFEERKKGFVSKLTALEDKFGYNFTYMKYNKQKKGNETALRKPTSFHGLNEYTKKNLIFVNGPFHTLQKNLVLHIRDGIAELLVPDQKMRVRKRWQSIKFPKGMKREIDPFKIGGNNFDAILGLIYVFPYSIRGIATPEVVMATEKCFDAIIGIRSKNGITIKKIKVHRHNFHQSIKVLAKRINIKFPTTHYAFHCFELAEVLGALDNWDEKKFEMFHRYFKTKMRRCFLRNPSVFLVKEYVSDSHLSVIYQDHFEKIEWVEFNPRISFKLYKNRGELLDMDLIKKTVDVLQIPKHLAPKCVVIRKLRIFTRVYAKGEQVSMSGKLRKVMDILLVSWMSADQRYEFQRFVFCCGSSEDCVVYVVNDLDGKVFLVNKNLVVKHFKS